MNKKELSLVAAPLLVIGALVLVTAGTKYAGKVRCSQEAIVVNAGIFNKEAGSRVLLQTLSSALKAHPDNNTFVVRWQVDLTLNDRVTQGSAFTFTYNRHEHLLQQGGSAGFQYKGVTDAAIHHMAEKDKTVVRFTLKPYNYTTIHLFTAKQRLAHHIEILPPDTSGGAVTIVEIRP